MTTAALLLTVAMATALALDDDGAISEARTARSRYLWRFCQAYLQETHDVGRTRIRHWHGRAEAGGHGPAIAAALVAARPFLNGDTDQPVSDLGQRLDLAQVQRGVGEYIAAAAAARPESSAGPAFPDLVRAHRAWRLLANIVGDALARVLHRHPDADRHVRQARTVMHVVGRAAFVLPVLARARAPGPHRSDGGGRYDPIRAVREPLREGGDQALAAHLVAMFDDRLPPVVERHGAAAVELLARLWWSGVAGLRRRRPCLEEFVLGTGIALADYLLASDPAMEEFAEQSSADLLLRTLPFDRMFDQWMGEIQSNLHDRLPDHVPNRSHLVSIIMEIFSDLERPRYLLQWLDDETDPSKRKSAGDAKRSLFESVEPILEAVLGCQASGPRS